MNTQARRSRRIRIGLLILLIAGLYALGSVTGLTNDIDAARIRAAIDSAGVWGWALFIVIFSLGELIHIPGMLFVLAAILAYGKLLGFALSTLGALVSVCVTFILIRGVGGKMLADIDSAWMKKMLARLDARPITTVLLLRMVFWIAPPLNYALALSSIRFRDYFIGSAFGLLVPIGGATVFFDWLIA